MPFTNVITTDTLLNTATMQISFNGSLLTTFSYDNATKAISATARAMEAMTTLADLRPAQKDVYGWLSRIVDIFAPPVKNLGFHTIELKKDATKIEFGCTLVGLTGYSAEWSPATGIIKLKARPAFTLAFAEFVEFINLHQKLIDMAGAY